MRTIPILIEDEKTMSEQTTVEFDTTRLDFLVAVDKLLRVAEEARRLRDKLLAQPRPEEGARDE